MDLFQIVILAIIQGITEVFPISSSSHLSLISEIFGWKAEGKAVDVILHAGSLVALLIYFRKDIYQLCKGSLSSLFKSN